MGCQLAVRALDALDGGGNGVRPVLRATKHVLLHSNRVVDDLAPEPTDQACVEVVVESPGNAVCDQVLFASLIAGGNVRSPFLSCHTPTVGLALGKESEDRRIDVVDVIPDLLDALGFGVVGIGHG